MKEDLTRYTNDELSLIVFNSELLHYHRHDDTWLIDYLDARYHYTTEQLDQLKLDLAEDLDGNIS